MPDVLVPEVITRYLAAAAEPDVEEVVGCFTDDAVVLGEGQTLRGRDEIRRRKAVPSKHAYTTRVRGAEAVGINSYVVHCVLEGDFPGSPMELTFRFSVRDGLIAGLGVAPCVKDVPLRGQDVAGLTSADGPGSLCIERASAV